MRITRASKEILEKREKLREAFMEYKAKRVIEWDNQRPLRLALRNNIDIDDMNADIENVEDKIVEFLVKEETTPVESE